MIKILLWILKNRKISTNSRLLITNYLLESINALPIKEIITYNLEGTVRINGKELTPEQAIQFKEGAVALENNGTYRVIKDQIAYEAIKMGIHSSLSMEMILMSKSALWLQEQEKKIISDLAGQEVV